MKSLLLNLSALFFIGLLCFGCKTQNKKPAAALSFSTENFEKKIGSCERPEERCLSVKISYPFAEGGVDSVTRKINDFISGTNLALLTFGENEPDLLLTPDSVVLELGEEYLDFLDDTDFEQGWFFESKGAVTYADSNYISMEFIQSTFTGGAHPNYYRQKNIFNKASGELLDWEDLITDLEGLKKAVESEFRKVREVSVDASLEAEGFWFENDDFILPVNFGLSEKGLELVYNPYEVAPYAYGSTDVLIEDWKKFK